MRGYKMDKKPVKMTEKEIRERELKKAMETVKAKIREHKDVFIRLRDK